MKCEDVADRLSAFIDGELPEAERLRVQQHLEACARCAADRESLSLAWDQVPALPRAAPRTDLWPRLEARLAGDSAPRPWPWLWWSPSLTLATAVLIVGLLLGLRLGDLIVKPNALAADASPERIEMQYFADVFPGSLAAAVLSQRVETENADRRRPGR